MITSRTAIDNDNFDTSILESVLSSSCFAMPDIINNNKQDSITLHLPEDSSTSTKTSSKADSNKSIDSSSSVDDDNNLASKDATAAAGDVERGVANDIHHRHSHSHGNKGDSDDTSASMRGRADKIGPQWKSPFQPEENHTNPQYLPSFIRRSATSFISLPVMKPIWNYISGGQSSQRSISSQPRLWNFKYIDKYIELPLYRYTKKWSRYPLVLWLFLLAWFLGFTFLARAAWWNSGVGNNVEWLSGTSTYWQRNDGCGLGRLLEHVRIMKTRPANVYILADGQNCAPFEGFTASYRCPSKVASTRLLNYRA